MAHKIQKIIIHYEGRNIDKRKKFFWTKIGIFYIYILMEVANFYYQLEKHNKNYFYEQTG